MRLYGLIGIGMQNPKRYLHPKSLYIPLACILDRCRLSPFEGGLLVNAPAIGFRII